MSGSVKDTGNTGYHIIVRGRVQGVGYRYFIHKYANIFGVSGYARNRSDGSVEIEATGEPGHMRSFIDICKQGPPHARVDHFQAFEAPIDVTGEFLIR